MSNTLLQSWRRLPENTRGYFVAAATTVVAAAFGILLRPYLDRSVFILFAAPIALTAWYGGRGPALAATFFGLTAADLIFLRQRSFYLPSEPSDVVAIGVYLVVALTIVHLSTLLRLSRAEAQDHAKALQDQAMELELQTTELEQQTHEAQILSEELEEAHEELKLRTNAQLSEAQALARLGSWEWDIVNDSITWSDEMYRLYALDPSSEPIDYQRYQSLLHPDDRDVSGEAVKHSLDTGQPFSFDHRIIRADGVERIFHARGRVVRGDDGKPLRMYGTGQDVTETRRAAAALQRAAEYAARQATAEAAAQHLNRVFAQAPVVIAVLAGAEHRFELVNEKGYETIGRSLLGRTVAEALPELAAQGFVKLLNTVFEKNEPFVGNEIFARLTEGEGGYFNFVFQPLSSDTGVYAVLVVATDVSDLVRARLAAEEAQREAQAASRAKSDFLARMSHELRTPLAAIIGYGELLSDGITGPINDEQKRQLRRIRASANHLLSIIDEILTLARMEAGKEKVELREVDISELMDSVASMAEPLASAKGLSFRMEIEPADLSMKTDPVKLRQVLLNLLSNAVKYTDAGEISVRSEAEDGVVNFLVTDTGVGVSEEHLEKIFEPFWQVEHTTT
ncbi:MAG TPA: histidine kinase dimerization/phospho-acceptor domain-containing protein, partial [Gemmatimonadaceae bacterium]|nr:histidine kinase dimerization/phospho-acceptor domain-containing protein [Gemmatimonadaceae bacterium]